MRSNFSVAVEDFANINNPEESVSFFRELLWAEATKWKIAKSHINVPSNIFASDGGINAEVRGVNVPTASGLIKEGLTRYQLKAGNYKLDAVGIKKLLFREKTSQLKPRIKTCLDQDGTFVVVLFDPEVDNPDRDDVRSLENKIKGELSNMDEKYQNAKVEIIMPNTLASYVNSFPSLCLKLKRLDNQDFLSHSAWAELPDMRVSLKISEKNQERLKQYQQEVRDVDRAIHIRVNGEPGIGKTRFVLEMLREEDLAPNVIYYETPQVVYPVLINHVSSRDKDTHVILVVDECDRLQMMDLWRRVEGSGDRVKLITIYSEADEEDVGGETKQLEVEGLDDLQIANIIGIYGAFPIDQINRWIPYCSGFPRVAHVLGQNLVTNPEDLMKSPDTVPVWERFIAGKDKINSPIYIERKEVLMWLSLFKKFGYETPYDVEFELLRQKIENRTGILFNTIHSVIRDMRIRKILQGKATLYITPKLLHIKLWTWWWETYGKSADAKIENFIVIDSSVHPPQQLNSHLINWYCEMFRYARESTQASIVVRDLLGIDGPFQSVDFFATGIGSRLFYSLAEANPEATLRMLQKVVGKLSKEQLLHFKEGRRVVVDALETIAIKKNLFQDSARLLLALGEAENEDWTNNASGIFVTMFSNGYGKMSPTAAPPELKFPVIREALESSSKERRMLALKACNAALETLRLTRVAKDVDKGLRKEAELWTPKTMEEWFQSLARIWRFLSEKVDQLQDAEKTEAIRILLDRSRGLSRIKALSPMVLDTMESLVKKSYVSRKDLLDAVLTVLRFEKENLPTETLARWENLKEEVTGRDYPSKMKRYVGIVLLHDTMAEEDALDPIQTKIAELAKESVLQKDLLAKELTWLTTKKAENGYLFGYKLAENDRDYSLLCMLLDAQRKSDADGSASFLGGYFNHIAEKDLARYEDELDKLADDPVLRKWMPEITWRARTTDKAAQRVIDLVKQGKVDRTVLRMFALGSAISNLKEKIIKEWIEFLLQQEGDFDSVALAANLSHFYYLDNYNKLELPNELIKRILMNDFFFGKVGGKPAREVMDSRPFGNTLIEHYWIELAKAYIAKYPEETLELGYKILEHLGDDWTIVSTYSEANELLTQIAKIHTLKIWGQASKYLGASTDRHTYAIQQWLRGDRLGDLGTGFLVNVPLLDIFKWVDEDVEKRAWYLARVVPNTPFFSEGRISPREILVRYGAREAVRSNLHSNFETEFFSGSESLHYREKKSYLLKLNQIETDPNVRRWLDEYIELLDKKIKGAENEEERFEL